MALERFIVSPENRSWHVVQPHRHASEVPLGGDKRPDSQDQEQPSVLDDLDESHQVEAVLKVVLAWGDLMAVPEDVGLDAVGAAVLGLGHQLGPHLGDAAGVVDGGGDEEAAAAGDDEGAVVVRHIGGGVERRQQQEEEEEREGGDGGRGGHGRRLGAERVRSRARWRCWWNK